MILYKVLVSDDAEFEIKREYRSTLLTISKIGLCSKPEDRSKTVALFFSNRYELLIFTTSLASMLDNSQEIEINNLDGKYVFERGACKRLIDALNVALNKPVDHVSDYIGMKIVTRWRELRKADPGKAATNRLDVTWAKELYLAGKQAEETLNLEVKSDEH